MAYKDRPGEDALITALYLITGMNVNINFNAKAWPDDPWEVRVYLDDDQAVFRSTSLRGGLITALAQAVSHGSK